MPRWMTVLVSITSIAASLATVAALFVK